MLIKQIDVTKGKMKKTNIRTIRVKEKEAEAHGKI